MVTYLIPALLALAPAVDDIHYTYEGNIIARKGIPAETRKSFSLDLYLLSSDSQQPTVLWTLAERGRGGWPWTRLFGECPVGTEWQPQSRGPSLLYNRGALNSVVPLVLPRIEPAKPLAIGTTWDVGKLTHTVVAKETVADMPTWKIEAGNAYGVRRRYWISTDSQTLVRMEQLTFLGQGEQYELTFDLKKQAPISASDRAQLPGQFDGWTKLRDLLRIQPDTEEPTWTAERLATLQSTLPSLAKDSANGPARTCRLRRDTRLEVAKRSLQLRRVSQEADHGQTAPRIPDDEYRQNPV